MAYAPPPPPVIDNRNFLDRNPRAAGWAYLGSMYLLTAGIALGSAVGRVVSDPTNPLADAQGNVRQPDIDMSSQMTQLIIAQRAYQADAAVIDRAKATYEAALQIGRSA